VISCKDQLSEAALKDIEFKDVVVNCDKMETRLEMVSQAESAIASPNSAQQEEDRIPRVIVTTCFPGAIASSSSPQAQKVKEQGGSGLGVVEQDRSAIAPANSTQELDPMPRVIVTSRIKGAIATSSTSQQRISEPQPPKDTTSPVLLSAKSQPVVPKKLSDEEIQKLEDELKRLSINPESCMAIVRKYWNNVGGAIARVKEAIQQNWCANPTGLFIASCKKGVKSEKTQVCNEVNEWFTWARAKRIVLAMSSGWVYTPEGEAVRLEEMMSLYPMTK